MMRESSVGCRPALGHLDADNHGARDVTGHGDERIFVTDDRSALFGCEHLEDSSFRIGQDHGYWTWWVHWRGIGRVSRIFD